MQQQRLPMGIAQPGPQRPQGPQVPPNVARSPQFGAAKEIAMDGLPQLFKQLFDDQVTFQAMELLEGAQREEAMNNAPSPDSIKGKNEQGLNALFASIGPGIRQRGDQLAQQQQQQQQSANNMPMAAQGGIVGYAPGGYTGRKYGQKNPQKFSGEEPKSLLDRVGNLFTGQSTSPTEGMTDAERLQYLRNLKEQRKRAGASEEELQRIQDDINSYEGTTTAPGMAGGGIVSFKEGGQPPMYEQQFTTDFSRGANDRQAAFEDISSWVRNYQIEPEIADIVLNNPNSVAGDQINVLKQVLIGAGGRTLDEINEIVGSFASLQNRGNVNPRGERDFSRAEEPVEGRGLMALGQERAAQNAAAREARAGMPSQPMSPEEIARARVQAGLGSGITSGEAPLSDFQQSLVDAEEANVGQQLRNAERRMEYAERPQGLEGQRFSPGNRMPPEEVERRREEYRRSRSGVAPQEPTESEDGEGYDFGALAEGLGITGLLDTAKQVGQDVFMGGYSAEELLNKTMPTRMEALGEGRGLMDLDEYEQGAVGREALTFVPRYLQSILSPNPENTRLGTATLGGIAEGIAPRAKGFLGMERDPDAEVAAEVITSGPEEISADSPPGRVDVGGRRTQEQQLGTAGLQAPSNLVSALDRGNQTADQIQTGLAAFDSDARRGAQAGAGTSPNVTAGVQNLQNLANSAGSGGMQNYQDEIDRLIARDTNPIRTLAQYAMGVGKGNTPIEGMMLGSEMINGLEKKLDADKRALMGLIEAQRISERDAAQAQERLRIQEAQVEAMREGDYARLLGNLYSADQRTRLTAGDIARIRYDVSENEGLTGNLREIATRRLLEQELGENANKGSFFGRSEAEKLLDDPTFQAQVDILVRQLEDQETQRITGQ